MFAQYNRIATLYTLVVRQGAIGPWHHKTKRAPTPKIQDAIGPFKILESDGEFKPVGLPPMSIEAKELFSAVSGHLQRGAAPFSAFGQAPFQLSGIAISQLQGALELRTVQLSNSMKTVYRTASQGIIEQFINIGRQVKLAGVDRRQRPFLEAFRAADLRKKYHLDFDHRTDMPVQRMQEANIATMWAQLGVSLVRIYDELLHIQDPNWEYRRKLMEMADQNPVVAGLKLARLFAEKARIARDNAKPEEAAEMLEYRNIVLAQIQSAQQQAQQMAAPQLPRPEAASPETFGRGGSFSMNEQNLPTEARLEAAGLVGPQG